MSGDDADARICAFLDAHHIAYERFDHPPVFTCEETEQHVPASARGIQTKNLFLRDKPGRRHLLVVTACEKAVDIRTLGVDLDVGRLSFGSAERLVRCLGVTPGSVTLLALAHEGAAEVEVVIDADIWNGEPLKCHPMVNTATLVLEQQGVIRFLEATGHVPIVRRLEVLGAREAGRTGRGEDLQT